MESPILTGESVSADVSEFFRAELEAFVAMSKRQRPAAWLRVEQLQRACRCESPTAATGLRPLQREAAEPTVAFASLLRARLGACRTARS